MSLDFEPKAQSMASLSLFLFLSLSLSLSLSPPTFLSLFGAALSVSDNEYCSYVVTLCVCLLVDCLVHYMIVCVYMCKVPSHDVHDHVCTYMCTFTCICNHIHV